MSLLSLILYFLYKPIQQQVSTSSTHQHVISTSTNFIPNYPYYFTAILSNSTISLTYVMKRILKILLSIQTFISFFEPIIKIIDVFLPHDKCMISYCLLRGILLALLKVFLQGW